MPLRTTLENFINHVESLESKKKEGEDLYEKEFKLLKTLTETLRNSPQFSSHHGENDVNRKKNRYKDIVPYDYTRVTVSPIPGVPTSDYVNASYIKGASGSMAYIASQGPLPSTVDDFWRMIWECEIQVIIMACNEVESGKHKCEKYWADRGEEKIFGNIKVKFVRIKQVCPEFLVRTMVANSEKEERTIVHFHYISWPDHGIPTSVKPILKMIKLIRGCQPSETLPVLVHCSAGCGRTGTICAIDYVWGLLRTGKLSDDFSLFQLVSSMRKQRIAMVQTKDQYILVYRAVKELFEEHLQVMDSHLYENVDFSGTPLMLLESCAFIDEDDDNKNSSKNHIYENPSPDKTESEPSISEAGSSGKVQQLISTWNSGKTDTEIESPVSADTTSITTSTASLATSPTDPDLQEKAVILRKPSIAKLRAIFEKNDVTPLETSVNKEVVQPRRTKSKKKLIGDKTKTRNETGARYQDTALRVYSEFRHKKEEATAKCEIRIIEPTPEVVRREKVIRNSLRRSSSSVWYDEEGKKSDEEKPALPVKRSKSLKMFKQPSKVSPTEEMGVNGHVMEPAGDSSLPKGVIKLKSSPWNPRRSQSMKTTTEEKPSIKERQKPWYLFSDKDPDVVAGFHEPSGIQLVQVKINSDDKQVVFSEGSFEKVTASSKEKFDNISEQAEGLDTCCSDAKTPACKIGADMASISNESLGSSRTTSPVEGKISKKALGIEGKTRKSSPIEEKTSRKASPIEEKTSRKASPVDENSSFIVKAKQIEFTIHEPVVKTKWTVPKVEKIKYQPQRAFVEIADVDERPPLPVKMNSPMNSPRPRRGNRELLNINEEKLVTKEIIPKKDNWEVVAPRSDITDDSTPAETPEIDIREEENSYQQIIKDCQEYLIHSGLNENNVQTESETCSRHNEVTNCDSIKKIVSENAAKVSPVPEEFYLAEDVQEIMREIEASGAEVERESSPLVTPKKHYEQLWFSHSGKTNSGDVDDDLRSYKIVQQVLNSRKNSDDSGLNSPPYANIDINCSGDRREKVVERVIKPEKPKKPKPLPRKILPAVDVVDTVDFSSEDDDREPCIYSEVCKEKPKRLFNGSKDDLDLLPSAPPRLKRQFSLQQPKAAPVVDDAYQWRHTLPSRLPGDLKKVKLKNEWGEEWHSDDDCTPPVPEKTREAYMLPNDDSKEKVKRSESTESEKNSGIRSLTKFGILSKLGIKVETRNTDDNCKSKQTNTNGFSEYAYPHRLNKKPQGPRQPPVEWTAPTKTDVPS